MTIRVAAPSDAEAVCDVLRRSIETLCVADHEDDPDLKRDWLANKTPETVRRWIAAPDGCVLVAETDGRIAGAGAANTKGEITLNYVAPEARFRGISKAMVAALEAWLIAQGASTSRLSSTTTAHRFYLSAGYTNAQDCGLSGPLSCRPMTKTLARR